MMHEQGHQLPLPGLDVSGTPRRDQQLALLGEPAPVRVSAMLWQSWLDDVDVVARFTAKCYRRGDQQCWPWLGAISSTGHGSFRAASLPGPSRKGTVPAHIFAFQLTHGLIPRLGWSETDPCLCHRCDESGCVNPAHLRVGTCAENRTEWAQRHRNPSGPLADLRGAAGRARAVGAVLRASIAAHLSTEQIEARLSAVQSAGLPLTLW